MQPDDDNTRTHIVLTKGTMVGHYRIVEKIGAGGMGEVYLVEDTKLNRKVALKFLPSHLSQNEEYRLRFTREAQASAKLDHPNIVPIYEVSEHQSQPFFAMAHIVGKSLREVIKENKLSTNQAVELTMQICEGLHKAHESGVVHRDIKPANIIIDNENRARIVDFGLATITGEEKLTKTGSTLGTVGYMAPEQVAGENTDHRSDIFSVGVILYEMLTGRRPFEGDNDVAIVRAITDSTPEPIARFKSGVTGELQQIVDKALEKNAKARYQHADGMLSDLMRVKRAQDSGQSLTPVATPSRRFSVLSYVLLIVGIVAVGIIAGMLFFNDSDRRVVVPEFRKITYTGDAYYSAISPDGTYYVYSRFDKETGGLTVFVSDFEGGQAISVFECDYVQSICWSPDGKELLLRARKTGDTTEPSVYLVPRLGGREHRFDVPGSPTYYWDIAWLPDGSGFVSIADANRLIYIDKITEDTTIVPLGNEFVDIQVGNFSPDGRWLVIIGVSEDGLGLWLVSSDGIDIHRLGDGVFMSARWSPSGDAIYALEPSVSSSGFRLWRFNIDLQSGELEGEPEALLSGLPATIGISISGDGKRLL
ncbi:MAG: protein kinase, partial [FCB group bacterium]|nr:protein kinase [FCB group bacterium]